MLQSKNKQIFFHLILIAVFSLLAMSSVFYNGITSGNDSMQHYQFALTIHDSIISHEFYPSFAETPNRGFGDVGLRFYPPFSYYVLSVTYIFAQNWYFAALIAFFLVFWVGGTGIYFWAREELSPQQSILAAGIYTFAPYHLNQIYNNFLFAEFSATAVIPFCFLFLTRVCRKGGKWNVLGLAIAYALLILTHLPLTIIGSITLAVYSLFLLRKENFISTVPKLFLAVVAALALSAFYWSRMITEFSWIKHSTPQYFSETWDYRTNFLFKPENILNFQDDVLCLWLADLMLLAILLISIPAVIILIRKRFAVSKFVLAISTVFFMAVLMTTPLSKFIWDTFGFLQKVQFPWRWMGIISAFGALFASLGIIRASEMLKDSKNILLPLGLGAVLLVFVFTSAFIMKGAVYHPRDEFNRQMQDISGAQSFDCWWTIWAQRSAFEQTEKILADNREINVQNWSATEKIFSVSSGEAVNVKVSIFYYPHWKATVNNQLIEISPTENGLISFSVPAQTSEVYLHFEEPPHIRLAFYISGFAWAIVLGSLSVGLICSVFNLLKIKFYKL